MNILSICHYEYYQYISSSFIHKQAAAFVKLGHNVRVIVLTPFGKKGMDNRYSLITEYSEIDGVEVCYLRYLSLSKWGTKGFNEFSTELFYAINMKFNNKVFIPDVIHAHTLGICRFASTLKKIYKCPLIATTHGSDTNTLFQRKEYDRIVELCNNTDAIIAVSTSLKNRLQLSGIAKQVYVVLNGYQATGLKPDLNKKEKNSWIQVGHLIKIKHVDITIKAFCKFKKENPDAKLTIIGEGAERHNLEKLCEQMGVTDVFFLGQLDNASVLSELAKAEYFVMDSYPEGLGIAYLEALSQGCITIGCKSEGISDVIKNGENGFLVEADDVDGVLDNISKCQIDHEYKKEISARAIETVSKLSWERNAEEMIQIFANYGDHKSGRV